MNALRIRLFSSKSEEQAPGVRYFDLEKQRGEYYFAEENQVNHKIT